jgi:hypothetical protein
MNKSRCGGKVLKPAHEQQDEQNQKDQAQSAARVITPTCAVGPGGECSNYKQKHDDQEDQSHSVLTLVQSRDGTATRARELLALT